MYQKQFGGLSVLVKWSPLYSCSLRLIPAKTSFLGWFQRWIQIHSNNQFTLIQVIREYFTPSHNSHIFYVCKRVWNSPCCLWWQGRGGNAGEWEKFLYLFKTKQRFRYVCMHFEKASFFKKTLDFLLELVCVSWQCFRGIVQGAFSGLFYTLLRITSILSACCIFVY